MSSLTVEKHKPRARSPNHLDYTIQFPVPKSEVNTLRRFMDKTDKLFGVKVILTSVIPAAQNEDVQQLIQVSSRNRNKQDAEEAQRYIENLCKGSYQTTVRCDTRKYPSLRETQNSLEKETQIVISFTKEGEIMIQGDTETHVNKIKSILQDAIKNTPV